MIVIFVGDIVGDRATAFVAEHLPGLREHYSADLVIANAENSAPGGLGMTARQVDELERAGVDIITGGNHSWDSEESVEQLSREWVLRPANLADGVPGHGVVHLTVEGEELTVINLADHCAMKSVKAAAGAFLPAYETWSRTDRRGTVIVDYHGDHVREKQIFAYAVAGAAAAVFGSHTHEPTMPLCVLPGGTAFVTDVGMTGPQGGIQGFAPDNLVAGLRTTGNPFSEGMPTVGEGPIRLGAVVVEVRDDRAVRLERIPTPTGRFIALA